MATATGKPYRRYRMNVVGRFGATTTVAIPPEVLKERAKELGLTEEEFIKRFELMVFPEVRPLIYTFAEKEESNG